ncbi:conserved hypothetical protein [Ricinus communis]|uniref:Uncharacterized protein n=1 Tax=Ricinus communis TaxID=3988 RepID=B9SDW2_RICCO|nr:conserved hypothetical protein [Ricinus communis]
MDALSLLLKDPSPSLLEDNWSTKKVKVCDSEGKTHSSLVKEGVLCRDKISQLFTPMDEVVEGPKYFAINKDDVRIGDGTQPMIGKATVVDFDEHMDDCLGPWMHAAKKGRKFVKKADG